MQRPVSSISPLQGLHFMVHNAVPDKLEGYTPSKCNLFTLYRFSQDVFVDPYELEQRFQDGVLPKSQVWGETDLELPVSAVEEGSLVLLGPLATTLDFDLPIHARYPLPSTTESHATVLIQTPQVLTVCTGRHEKKRRQSHEQLFLPYTSPFDLELYKVEARPFHVNETMFIKLPRGNQGHLKLVEPLTVIFVLISSLYISYKLWQVPHRMRQEPERKRD
ncbi:hypothetical protein CPB86DRAFT_750624 [Serendipita vermifera]|nr:hypothetical protein CPB86DRAFT_750624 [Serendipita vermifera]